MEPRKGRTNLDCSPELLGSASAQGPTERAPLEFHRGLKVVKISVPSLATREIRVRIPSGPTFWGPWSNGKTPSAVRLMRPNGGLQNRRFPFSPRWFLFDGGEERRYFGRSAASQGAESRVQTPPGPPFCGPVAECPSGKHGFAYSPSIF